MSSTLLNFIYLLNLVCWIGSIIFFSFFVAPAVFKSLDREKAGELVGYIVPGYYRVSYVCGSLLLVVLLLAGFESVGLKWCAWGIMMLGSVIAGLGLNPKARSLKEKIKNASEVEKPDLETRFKILHSLSVKLNATVLFAGLWLLWLSAGKFKI